MSASSPPPVPPIPPVQIPPSVNQDAVATTSLPQDDLVVKNLTNKKPKRLGVLFGQSLFFAILSLIIFFIIHAGYKGSVLLTFAALMWIVLGVGVVSLLIGFVIWLRFLFASRLQRISDALRGLVVFGILGLSAQYLVRVIIIILITTAQLGMIAGTVVVCTPPGLAVLAIVSAIDTAIKDHMANSTGPEWRMIKAEYLGSDLPDAPGKASFLLTNTGPHKISSMKGKFHAWTLFHVEKTVTFETTAPLEPGESIRLDYSLDGFGGQVKDIIDGKNKDVNTVAANVADYLDKNLEEDVAHIGGSSGPPPLNPNPLPEIDYHLRFQLQKMEASDGRRYVAWLGNMEIADKNAFFDMMRDFTSPEWKMIKVEYLDEQNAKHPDQASFKLTNLGKLTISSMKGKFHVMDITKGHVEKTVTLTPEKPLATGDSMVFNLSAGSESELAKQIIARESEYDRRVGNKEQTSYLMRFQLQELHTSDSRKIWVWFGELKGDIKPEEK